MLTNIYLLEQMAHEIPQERLREAERRGRLMQALDILTRSRKLNAESRRASDAQAAEKARASKMLPMLER